MKLSEAIAVAFGVPPRLGCGRKIREVLDFMRFRLGLTYHQSFATVRRVLPAIGPSEYEEYCRMADDDDV